MAMPTARVATGPTVAVALGAGGARGLAHIVVLEALDELGVRPIAISGASMGAIVGAAYAAGIPAAELRMHVLRMFRNRTQIIARLMKARVGRLSDFLVRLDSNPVLVDAELLLDFFWPNAVPDRFEELQIPLTVVATDYHGRCAAIFDSGPLAPAVAGSMALPGLIKPVEMNGLVLVDGGMVDPLPYRSLLSKADIVIACDVTGAAPNRQHTSPQPYETIIGAAQIVQHTISAEMLKVDRPHILLRPTVENFRALDFFRAAQIFEAAHNVKDVIKRAFDKQLKRA